MPAQWRVADGGNDHWYEPNNCCGGENYLHGNFNAALGWNAWLR